jgi:hypothetical protein
MVPAILSSIQKREASAKIIRETLVYSLAESVSLLFFLPWLLEAKSMVKAQYAASKLKVQRSTPDQP